MTPGLWQQMQAARQAGGPSLLRQAAEMVRLRFGPGRLGPSEYMDYRLYLDEAGAFEQLREFGGWRMVEALDKRFNRTTWLGLINDKLLMYALFDVLQVPYPRIEAVVNSNGRAIPGAARLASRALFEHWLSELAQPVFAKPIHGASAAGAFRIESTASKSPLMVVLHDGERVSSEALWQRCSSGEGYLLQQLAGQHPRLDELCGGRVSGLRMCVLLESEGPWLCRVTWKIATGSNLVDNFHYGGRGNLIAAIDAESGEVQRIVGGMGAETELFAAHPDSGEPLLGQLLPEYSNARDFLLQLAPQFPHLRFQHWDVVLGRHGPQFLEMNNNGDLFLAQQAEWRGFLDSRFRRACGA